MFTIDAALRAALGRPSVRPIARLTVLWPDGSERHRFDLDRRVVESGSVRSELRRDVRRDATLALVDVGDTLLAPALPDDLFAEGSRVVISRGARVAGVPLYAPLIAGFVSGCEVTMAGRLDLAVESHMVALDQDVGEGLILDAGTFLPDALHALWDPVLPGYEWVIDETSASRALGAVIPVLATDNRLDAGLQLASVLGCVAYDDRVGRIVVAVRPDPTTQPTARTMTDPLTLSRRGGRQPVNAQPVESSPGEAAPFYVLEQVDDPASPVHRNRIGLRVAPTVRSDSIPDPDTARAMARRLLAARALTQDSLSVTGLPGDLDLDEGDIVERTEAVSRTSGRYLVESIEYPVVRGSIRTSESSVVPLYLTESR